VKPARSSIAKKVEALNGNFVADSQPEPEPEPVVSQPIVEEPVDEPEPEPEKFVAAQEVVNKVVPEEPTQIQQPQFTNEPPIDDDEQFSTIKRSPHTKSIQENEVEAIQPPPPQQAVATNNEIGKH
jgi:drebrin-like protein